MKNINEIIFNALNLVSKDKYREAQDLVESILNDQSRNGDLKTDHWQSIGDIYLSAGEFEKAKDAYIKSKNDVSLTFVFILMNNLKNASEVLLKTNPSPANKWCEFLLSIFSNSKIYNYPSFLMIRHFLEMTVYYLLLAKNYSGIQLLMKHLNNLININLDTEKLIGYAYLHYGDLDKAYVFLNNALKRNKVDAEIYYMLGRLFYAKDEYKKAQDMLQKAKILLPEHFPTTELLLEIERKILN